jgi:cell division septation protein DedD
MPEDNRITRNQFNILLVTGAITIILTLLLGITIGKNMNLPQRFLPAADLSKNVERKGESIDSMDEISSLPARQNQSSVKPHVDDEGYTFYNAMTDTEGVETPGTKTIIESFSNLSKTSEVTSSETEDKTKPPDSAPLPTHTLPTPDPYATANPAFTEAYAVQMSSVSNRKYAENSVKEFHRKGYPAYISKVQFNTGRTHYRVRVGPYTTRETADNIMHKLKEETKTTPLVMTLRNSEL